ncbi:MAG: hypothetical protein ACE5GQ_10760 [Nitrospinales bacterium]
MKFLRLLIILIVCCSTLPAHAQTAAGLVIGENLKVGMTLADAFKLLGFAQAIQAKRGTDPKFDSIAIEYPAHGVVIQSLSGSGSVEGIEATKSFRGRFASGIKIGDNFKTIIGKYGVPDSLTSNVVRYPNLGLFFILDKGKLVSAKAFAKNSKLLGKRLVSSAQ